MRLCTHVPTEAIYIPWEIESSGSNITTGSFLKLSRDTSIHA